MINDSSPMRGHPLVVAYLRSDASSIYTDVLQPYLTQKGILYEQYAPASLELETDLSKWPLFMREDELGIAEANRYASFDKWSTRCPG